MNWSSFFKNCFIYMHICFSTVSLFCMEQYSPASCSIIGDVIALMGSNYAKSSKGNLTELNGKNSNEFYTLLLQECPHIGHIAVERSAISVLAFLQKMKFDFFQKGLKPYFLPPAFYVKDLIAINWFKENGYMDKPYGYTGKTPLLYFSMSGKVNLVKKILEVNSEYIYQKDSKGYGLLSYACLSGNVELINHLIEKGLSINSNDPQALSFAKNEKVIELLIPYINKDDKKSYYQKLEQASYKAYELENKEAYKKLIELRKAADH